MIAAASAAMTGGPQRAVCLRLRCARPFFSRSESLPFNQEESHESRSAIVQAARCDARNQSRAGCRADCIPYRDSERESAIIVGGNVDNPKDADVKSWDEAIAELESRQ